MIMTRTAVEIDPRLIAFVLPSIPESVRIARFHIRAALGFHGVGEYADDAETITSELVTNAVQHVCDDGTGTIGVTLARVWNPAAVTVIVSDSSREGPIRRDASADSLQGRGLQIVEALSAHWGWHRQHGGKAIFAVLAQEA
jgi:anti-sigma regulatory factor (Ser/Thr protein kinase)